MNTLQNEARLMIEQFEVNIMQANPNKFQGMLKSTKGMFEFSRGNWN